MTDEEIQVIQARLTTALESGPWTKLERMPDAWWEASQIVNGAGEVVVYTTLNTTKADEIYLLYGRHDMERLLIENTEMRGILEKVIFAGRAGNGWIKSCPFCHTKGSEWIDHSHTCIVTHARAVLGENHE